MNFLKLDDNYHASPCRLSDKLEARKCHVFTYKVNHPFCFNRMATMWFWFNTQLGHRDNWYKECNLMIGGR